MSDTWDGAAQPSRESPVRTQARLRSPEFQLTCRCISEDECLWPQDSASWGGVLGGVIIQQMTNTVGYDMTPV